MYACTDTEYHTNAIKDTQLTETRGFNGCPQSFCNDAIISIDTTVYVVNGCSITVYYTVESCPTIIVVRDFSYTIGTGSACTNLSQVWNQYYLNGQSILANEALNDLYRTLTLLVQNTVFSNLDPNDFTPGLSNYDFQFIETKCHTMCVDISYDEGEIILGGITQVQCGKGCCARVTKFVFKSNGDPVPISTEIREGNQCTPITVRCDYTYNPEDCQPACSRL